MKRKLQILYTLIFIKHNRQTKKTIGREINANPIPFLTDRHIHREASLPKENKME